MVFVLLGFPQYVASIPLLYSLIWLSLALCRSLTTAITVSLAPEYSNLRCVLFLGTLDTIPGRGYNLSKLPAVPSDVRKL